MNSPVDHMQATISSLQAEVNRLRCSERELAGIVELGNDAIIRSTLDGRIVSWNGSAHSMFGYSAQEAIGKSGQMLIPPSRQAEEMRVLRELAHATVVAEFDSVRLSRGGEPLNVSIKSLPIRDAEGYVVGTTTIMRDTSCQRRTEDALRNSEERLRFTLEAAHIGDWDLDLTTGVMQHSARHDQCFGHAEPQVEWSFDKFVDHVYPEDRAEVEQTLHVAITELRDWRVQCRVVWPDKSIHWVSKHGSVQSNGGKATRMLGIISEITEQRQAENARLTAQRLEAENRQIQEANRLKSQFLANMSHELRTPLNAVIGFADLLHSGVIKPDSPKHQEFLGHIGTSGRHLLQLINDVLDLSKVESGKLDFFPETVNLAVVLKEVQDILQTSITRKGIIVLTEIDPGMTDLILDPARLRQVLYNYLSNAIKFTAAGGHVTVRALAEGPEHFRVEIEDTGIGISPVDLPRLFTEFQQLDAGYSKQHQGTGLGLALTRRLVLAQGGQVGVRSTVGEGSVFFVVLNRIHGLDTERADSAAKDVLTREADRVLVIEDDQRDQALMVDAFSEAGFRVDAASNGPYALRRARDTAYSALTLDLRLADQRGLEVAVSMPADQTLSAAFAIANVLCKPIRSDEIRAAMARFRSPQKGGAKVMVIDDEPISLVQVLDALARLPAWRFVPVFIWTSMLLTDEEYATLARSARAILMKGGGGMQDMLESVRRWRQPTVPGAEEVLS